LGYADFAYQEDGLMATTLQRKAYTLDTLRDEVQELVHQGVVDRQQPIYTLCRYIPEREWECFEIELEENEFLLRDHIIDLLSQEKWQDD
jgi:hypothetical protein